MATAAAPLNREHRRAPQRYVPALAPLAEAADFLDVDVRTVRRMAAAGKLRAYRVGRLLKVDMHEVHALATPVPPESISV